MLFDIFLSRCASWDEVQSGKPPSAPPRGRIASWIFGPAKAPLPIAEADFHAAMTDAPALKRSDGTYWVRYPEGGEPWFAARFEPAGGHVVLSFSYSSARFLRNWGDGFDMALNLARELGA